MQHLVRTLKEQRLWVRRFHTLKEPTETLEGFRQRYNEPCLVEGLHFQSPRQAHQALLGLEPAA